jgi:glycosyltransferase involved in cell wall biosynthesis
MRERFISVVIPSRNASRTIAECLRAVYASAYSNYEVIVVDDASSDGSREIIKRFPCRLVELEKRAGVSKARNIGARHSRGEVLLFIDADCLLKRDSLALINQAFNSGAKVIGGTYTRIPKDSRGFFSTFQSVFVNYFETKDKPDYIAAHCLALEKKVFQEAGGFIEGSYIGFEAGVEDVELSHRLRRAGYELRMVPGLEVEHVFNFSLFKSLRNAYRKSMLWTMYSLRNRDLLKSSGTASRELKLNVFLYSAALLLVLLYLLSPAPAYLAGLPVIFALNLCLNLGLIRAFYETKGIIFALKASAYYFLVYPLAVGAGALTGAVRYFGGRK